MLKLIHPGVAETHRPVQRPLLNRKQAPERNGEEDCRNPEYETKGDSKFGRPCAEPSQTRRANLFP